MKIYSEQSLRYFEFWSGAKDTVKYLTFEDLDRIEAALEEIAPEEGYSDTEINDLFWFDDDLIAGFLGYDSFEELMEDWS